MASVQDVINAINDASNAISGRLDDVKGKLDAVNTGLGIIEGKLDSVDASVKQVGADVQQVQQLLLWGFEQLVTIGQYTNRALFQNDNQNDTMICILQRIAVNTCGIWNEAHSQTELQRSIDDDARKLALLYAATHGSAALTLEREEALQRQIEACCPPKAPELVCVESPCPAPAPFDEQPPVTEPPPAGPPPPPR
jgi:hypothetical protein